MSRWILTALLAVPVLVGCGVNPVTGERELRLISEREEIAIGNEHYGPTQQSMGGPYNADSALVEYVNEVGQRVAEKSGRPGLPYEFVVLNDSVPNAWALPGGKIAINRGLLLAMENEAELAAVLGHEIVHSAARHGAQRMERGMVLQAGVAAVGLATRDHDLHALIVGGAGVGAVLISQKNSRNAELESDYYGTRYMAAAGYDPEGAVTLQQKFVALAGAGDRNWLDGLFASHPPSQERVEANRRTARQLREKYDGAFRHGLGAERYARHMRALYESQEAYAAYDQGRSALAGGDAVRALALADSAVAAYGEEAAFHALRGAALIELGRDDEAEAVLDHALSLNGHYFAIHLERGLLAERRGDHRQARDHLERSNQLLPTAPAHFTLGALAEQRGDGGAAARHYRAAAESDSDYGRRARRALSRLEG